jgi:hypothetical protein
MAYVTSEESAPIARSAAQQTSIWSRIWAKLMEETPVDEEEERTFWWATR